MSTESTPDPIDRRAVLAIVAEAQNRLHPCSGGTCETATETDAILDRITALPACPVVSTPEPQPALDVAGLVAETSYRSALSALRQEATEKCGGGFGEPDLSTEYQLSLSLLVREVYQILNIEQHVDALRTALTTLAAQLAQEKIAREAQRRIGVRALEMERATREELRSNEDRVQHLMDEVRQCKLGQDATTRWNIKIQTQLSEADDDRMALREIIEELGERCRKHELRAAAAEKALAEITPMIERMAEQRLPHEHLTEEEVEGADYKTAYEMMVEDARAIRRVLPGGAG